MQNDSELSQSVSDKIDDQVKVIINYCYEQATSIIKENRILIDQLVEKLIQDETIEGKVFYKYLDIYAKSAN